MKTSGPSPHSLRKRRRGHPVAIGLARLMAAITLLNFGLVIFDMTFISLRDFYLSRLPFVTKAYDNIKGIEPYRDTAEYLKAVKAFEDQLNRTDNLDLNTSDKQAQLEVLRTLSIDMVNENPFQLANKSGTLEKIKNRMRDRLGLSSSKESFATFWSAEYLAQQGIDQELAWFNQEIVPLVNTNYFRPIGESGNFVDRFWLIDIWFIALFALDLFIRTLVIRRRRPGITLLDALLWRWYDWLLLIPFWRFLRILPVTLRSHQVGWIDLGRIEGQVTAYLAENLLDDLSEMILVRVFNIAQSTVRDGNLKKWLSSQTQVVEINEVNEIQVITERLMTVVIMKVLPKIQPDLEAVLRHAIEQGLQQLPIYKNLQFVPGINLFPNEVTKQLVHQMTDVTSQTLEETLKDEKGQELTSTLADAVVRSLRTELQDAALLAELQDLIGDLLEEWKLTLIQSFEAQDTEQTAAEMAKLRQSSNLNLTDSSIEVITPPKSLPADSTKIR